MLQKVAEDGLIRAVRHAGANSPFYAKLYARCGVDLDEFRGRADLARLPIVTTAALTGAHAELRARNVIPYRISSSSGTSQMPKTLFRTGADTDIGIDVLARLLTMAGLGAGDVLLIGQPFDLAHLGYLTLDACRRLGILALPVGLSMPDQRLIQIVTLYRPTAVFTAPSRMCAITAKIAGLPAHERPPVRHILLAGERTTREQQRQLREFWDVVPHSLYGSEETDGLGGTCEAHAGLHCMDDLFVFELLQPGTDQLAEGPVGELAVTSLYAEGSPLIRYRLGDLVRVLTGACACGRAWPRMEVLGRGDEVFALYDGIKLHAFQVRSALQSVCPEMDRFQAVCRTLDRGVEEVEVVVDDRDAAFRDGLADRLVTALWNCSLDVPAAAAIGSLRFRVTFGAPRHTARGKTPQFIDLRDGQADARSCLVSEDARR